MKKKSGFTLVEMLIVVVIIGILSSALLPRLSGYMAKTRDTKRQMDLKNVAAAIQMYRDQKGKFPDTGTGGMYPHFGPVSSLTEEISQYLSPIPKDPNKKSEILVYYAIIRHKKGLPQAYEYYTNLSKYFLEKSKGEYRYQKRRNGTPFDDNAILIAKVESVDGANYIATEGVWKGGLNVWNIESDSKSGIISLCSEIKKGNHFKIATKEDSTCVYTSSEQLHYVVKIE